MTTSRLTSPDGTALPTRPRLTPPRMNPLSALLHRTAALITAEQLPNADLTFHADSSIVSVGFSHVEQPENALRRWAQALELVVETQPSEDEQGCATELLCFAGHRDGVFWRGSWRRPATVTVTA